MTLPVPSLDDRRFQDLVDEAKRLIPRYCPEWTDHNLSDPGIALLELFAWLTEQTIYRLNRVPERLYVKFLELVGIELYSAAPARTDLLFRLAGPAAGPVRVPQGTQVAVDGQDDDPVVFITDAELAVSRPELVACLTRGSDETFVDVWDQLRLPSGRVTCFTTLVPGDALYLGFSGSLASHLIELEVVGSAEGAGIDISRPPRIWQAWDGEDWQPVRVLEDTSWGFNQDGLVTMLLPARHEPLPVQSTRAWWVRCRLQRPAPGQPSYDVSPLLDRLTVRCVGGTASAHHGRRVPAELLGRSDGTAGQVFQTGSTPVLARQPDEHVRVLLPRTDPDAPEVWQDWGEVPDFSATGPADRAYTWSGATGEIRFGPQIRLPDGGFSRHGAVPPIDSQVWVTSYRSGGGSRGNVGAGVLTSMRTSIPSVESVTNLDPATGGSDAETIENVKLRGPMELRGGQRAVTAQDYERLTLAAGAEVARALCLPPAGAADPVRVLIVPRVDIAPESLELHHLRLAPRLERQVADYLEPRRMLTTRVLIDRPSYFGISVAARVRAATGFRAEAVTAAALAALYRYINPFVGGPAGQGWPFVRPLNVGEIFALLGGVPGVAAVESVALFSADLARERGTRRVLPGDLGNVVPLAQEGMFASCDHEVVVE